MKWLVLALSLALMAIPAWAQQKALDARVAPQVISALQALVALREAELKAAQEDLQKRENDWAAYSAPLWKTDGSR